MTGKYSNPFPQYTQSPSQLSTSASSMEGEDEEEQMLLQHRYLSECMGGVLPSALDLSHIKRALDAPCEVGGCVYELAWNHPSL